jgi:hypothetical protein
MNEKLIVTRVSEQDEVYRVQNNSHEDPSEHTYQLFLQDGEPVHCECPSWEYHEGECKHMQAVEDKLESRRHWRDWQQVQKEREERERKRAVEARKTDSPSREQVKAGIVDAFVAASNEEVEEDDDDESVGSQLAREMLDEAKETKEEMMTEDEWRSMSSEGRSRLAAWL